MRLALRFFVHRYFKLFAFVGGGGVLSIRNRKGPLVARPRGGENQKSKEAVERAWKLRGRCGWFLDCLSLVAVGVSFYSFAFECLDERTRAAARLLARVLYLSFSLSLSLLDGFPDGVK